jgi:hypothetical protein
MSAIPTAHECKNCSAIRSIDSPRPRSVLNVVYIGAILTTPPRLYFLSMEYFALPMFAKRARCGYFTT